ncbi:MULTISPECIES: zinc ABC transporter substrate-binding protein ZnuA [unclassified Photobacterium]|uniref:zinc ABC transporter substrate-binding protein ZnuA n=1 Tax=unclassified Photobacterium TaxID=2628852 RepID=UPI001EDD6393|nr:MULTISPECIES: zinc ABC transporter substrate-binding protein ZnuA [unclassified Photobacterium]MCG3864621.1 zinc ABC transporter substrate-binding protein ZnuA [Photobacterium sp. Ph6]MCG3876102.1 zinc ABC transporter substrate-binding protein ZnuA [Photobacterium sp. Ph5]
MQRISSFACVAALVLSSSAMAKEFNVVTTIKPLNLIVSELTQGAATSTAILPPGVSPHDYALRPSDVKKLNNADLVIWVGPQLETFLTKLMATNPNSFALTQQAGINFLNYGGEKATQHAEHSDHEGHDDHADHDGHDDHAGHHHDHSGLNPHFWMGPKQTIEAANVITKALIKHDPLHKTVYLDNLSTFTSEVNQAVTDLNAELKPVSNKGYYVFHDGYGYFEHQFDLNNLGHFTVEPDRRPGAKTLITIRKALQDNKAYCVFSEPQFSPAVVDSVTSGTDVNIGTLDPMATNVKEGKGGYVRFIKELGQSFAKCLK